MEYFEGEGKTIDEALHQICEEHGLDSDDLEYEIIETKKRVLGILGREAVAIKAWLKKGDEQDLLEICNRICALAGFQSMASCREEDGETLLIEMTGEDLNAIIGKNGEVLDALQYLLNKIANRKGGRLRRITVDADGFRERKIENLKRLAIRSAEKVKATGRSVILDPMNAHDRRIIHITLKEDPEVFSKSLGDSHFKKVMIALKKTGRYGDRDKRRI